MPYEPFLERFGELAWKETRSVTVFENHPALPADEYGLIELYCNDEACDCRRVMLDVVSRQLNKSVAVVAYGWENAAFYARWFGQSDPKIIKEMQGPELNLGSPQSKLAPAALELVKDVLKDQNYVARIKRHYKLFKERIDRKPAQIITRPEIPALPELPATLISPVLPEHSTKKSRKHRHISSGKG